MMNDTLFAIVEALDMSSPSCVNSLNPFVKRYLYLIYKLFYQFLILIYYNVMNVNIFI